MNILFCKWNIIGEEEVQRSFTRLGFSFTCFSQIPKSVDYDNDYLNTLGDLLTCKKYDYVFSLNYIPLISRVCNLLKIPYISWSLDCPEIMLYSKTITNKCNYIFVFDKAMQSHFSTYAPGRFFYLPLGNDCEYWNKHLGPLLYPLTYNDDISFIGSLYNEKCKFNQINHLPEYLNGYANGLIEAQLTVYGYNFLSEVISDSYAQEFFHYSGYPPLGVDYFQDYKEIVAQDFLALKVTEQERIRLLNALSSQYEVSLYTKSDTTLLPNVHTKETLDYHNEMPNVIRHSKINLNFTSKAIQSGLPLRIFDILGCGGFLITNYQSELEQYFTIGEDLVTYDSQEDLVKKCGYYLSHKEEREEIAKKGYEKVQKNYTWDYQLQILFQFMQEETHS